MNINSADLKKVFTPEEMINVTKNIKKLSPEHKKILWESIKSMASEYGSRIPDSENYKRMENEATLMEKNPAAMQKIIDKEKILNRNASNKNLWEDPMILQNELDNKNKLDNTIAYQKRQRFQPNMIWKNLPNTTPYDTDSIKKWPNGEVIRQNSKWQYYYIGKDWRAAIVPTNNAVQDRLKGM